MDTIDLKILTLLQEDATLPVTEIAQQVGLSTTPCWRRIQRMEQEGVIRGRVVLLDRDKLNVGVTVFVAIRTRQHTMRWLEQFRAVVGEIPEIVEAYRLSGETDYLLRVVVPSIAAYDGVYKRMIERLDFDDVSSSFSMEEMKFTTAIPLGYARG